MKDLRIDCTMGTTLKSLIHKLILFPYLFTGRQVMLEQPKKSGGKLVSHILASHGGDSEFSVLVIIPQGF